ncbi:DUF4391 domain-containing protein [Allobacillus sp. SKP2-8]|uniref:DUF4391 domain-containing protein n=1 Tax=unclassified Allobacillus TaxID=2628859 RepID=UPI00118461BA|nr:DUF4391 domain-containing protein [Allobacillus sp. SKP2-8]TSJ65136.1 DUF4391 domain-containing protein [Allobacillus sp. SKP2-8]
MFNFPESTLFDRRIPKKKFYEHLQVNTKLEQLFVKEIDKIVWKYKLSLDTVNINAGKNVNEIEILEVHLKQDKVSQKIIEQIDREIPYHIVFLIEHGFMCQLWVSYKERHKNDEGRFKVNTYFKTDWMKKEELSLKIEGLNLDQVYESFIKQIGKGQIEINEEVTLEEAINNSKEKEKLKRQIQSLEKKIAKEKQFKKQVSMMSELRQLKERFDNE